MIDNKVNQFTDPQPYLFYDEKVGTEEQQSPSDSTKYASGSLIDNAIRQLTHLIIADALTASSRVPLGPGPPPHSLTTSVATTTPQGS